MLAIRSCLQNCFLAALLVFLLQTPSPHWFGIALSPLLPWSHVSQATRIRIREEGKKRGEEGKKRGEVGKKRWEVGKNLRSGIPEK